MAAVILASIVTALIVGVLCARLAWLDHIHHDPWLDVKRSMSREARKDFRRVIKRLRKSRREGTLDDVNWMRELRGERL